MPKKKTATKSTSPKKFPVVGLGASAGGLDALKAFFAEVSELSGMAYVVVVHMTPKQPSMLPALLQNVSSIPVTSAKDGQKIEPNHVYVLPPNKDISVFKGKIQLLEPLQKRISHQVDLFFRSLAQDCGNKAVAIILSGTGTDGTLGAKEIKGCEGLLIAQSEESADYDGMPRSAISTGLVDMVLPPEKMHQELMKYFSHPATNTDITTTTPGEQQEWLNKIFAILRTQIGHDFSLYKANTILRRIGRRMGLNGIDSHRTYVRYLRENPGEVEALFREMLIGVTNFFRDPESFEILKTKILPELLESLPEDTTLRAWIPGCSTGEEVYSLAMVLREMLGMNPKRITCQLFGTDIDSNAIDKAREGLFPASISTDVSKERLKRFFTKEGSFFRIRKEIRDSVVFSAQDVIKDPPFSRLDLLCCRNLLIYLDSEAQKKLLPLFHYTLKPNSVLMLGSSETIGGFSNLFETLNKKWKIFRRQEVPPALRQIVDFPSGLTNIDPMIEKKPVIHVNGQADINDLTQKAILKQFAPTAILITGRGDILNVQGRTGKYLETPSGPPTNNILDLTREGLRIELSSALRRAKSTRKKVTRQRIAIQGNGDVQLIDLHVCPQEAPQELAGRLLVVFEDIEHNPEGNGSEKDGNRTEFPDSSRIAELERELQVTRESHQTTIEELESSNEELKSTNEEMQSSNEELQSTNEELESSKEELQSLNEELQTVNSELQSKVDELSAAHDDMRNLMNSTEIATIFVDNDLLIRRFTSEATSIVNLIQTDIGRPLMHVLSNLRYDKMIADVEGVLKTLTSRETEVQNSDGRWFNMRILPYRTVSNVIDGAVLTFTDITEVKNTQLALHQSENRLKLVVENSGDVVSMIDLQGTYLYYSGPSRFRVDSREVVGKSVSDVTENSVAREVMTQVAEVATSGMGRNYETKILWEEEELYFMDYRYPIKNDNDEVIAVGTVGRNITDLKKTELKLKRSEERLKVALKTAPLDIIVAHINRELQYTWIHNSNPDFNLENALGKRDDEIEKNRGTDQLCKLKQRVLETGIGEKEDILLPMSDGARLCRVTVEPFLDIDGTIIGLTSASVDITDYHDTINTSSENIARKRT